MQIVRRYFTNAFSGIFHIFFYKILMQNMVLTFKRVEHSETKLIILLDVTNKNFFKE